MRVIDSHTEGEPTRVIIADGPDLGQGPLSARVERFREQHDYVRRRLILEPRGYDAMVGALLCEPDDKRCDAGVIFFNNRGYLGMCGHGTIGVAATLAYLGKAPTDLMRIETPVGIVTASLHDANHVTIENVPSYCFRDDVAVDVPGIGVVRGDIAWGGNWFFLTNDAPCDIRLDNEAVLRHTAMAIHQALLTHGITGEDGEEIDHIELFGAPQSSNADSRNYVLCPGGEYDRSPCGTGTSAKLACLAAKGALNAGESWVQESVIGSRFTASYRPTDDARIIVSLTGRAFVCADTQIIADPNDPFANGIA
ncbi:MAG: proline racemase family protein [Pseudomonadota bacterium]